MTTRKMNFAIALFALFIMGGITLAAQSGMGHLRVKIDPWNAGVFVDGKYVGTAAMYGHRSRTLPLRPGQHEVKFVDPRYETLVVRIQIEAGHTTTIRRGMTPAAHDVKGPFGELETHGFPNAAVYLNGKYYGNTKEFGTGGQQLLIHPGSYTMKIVPVDGSAPREEKITINADETLVINKTGAQIRRK